MHEPREPHLEGQNALRAASELDRGPLAFGRLGGSRPGGTRGLEDPHEGGQENGGPTKARLNGVREHPRYIPDPQIGSAKNNKNQSNQKL